MYPCPSAVCCLPAYSRVCVHFQQYLLTCSTEQSLSRRLSRNTRPLMEAGRTLPHLHYPNPQPDQLSPRHPISLPAAPHQYYAVIYACVFQMVSFARVSPPKPCMCLSYPHTCYRPHPSHSSRFQHPNSIVVINTNLFYSSCVLKYIRCQSPESSVRNRVQFSVSCCTLLP
jgi:hypothetical protein